MKNITKKIMIALLATSMVATMAVTTAFADGIAGNGIVENEYIRIADQTDDFYIDTVVGDPDNTNDDYTKLLYHTTSDMAIYVDGSYRTTNGGTVVDDDTADFIETTFADYKGISYKRVLTIISNNSTGREDTVEVKFIATNNDTENHEVGARIMLDTMLGSNDYAPFRVPGIGAVTKRLQLEGDDIPAMYQAFDDLENPSVVSTGSFATGAGRPDYIQFNNYSVSTGGGEWEIPCDTEESIGDSVVNAFWNPVTLAPGESRVFTAYYGLGAVTVSNESELILGATKVEQNFELNEEGTGYNPVSIMGYIKNTGDVALNNVELNIELPEGISLVDSEGAVNFGTVNISGENQTTWTLNAEPVTEEKEISVTIKAKSDETGEVEPITYTYTLPAIELPTEPPTEAPTEAPTEEPTQTPTEAPTEEPTQAPTEAPTEEPTQAPTEVPTEEPTQTPTEVPTEKPTQASTEAPTQAPTTVATQLATVAPTNATKAPTQPATTATTVTTTTTTTTGKVATGDSMASIMLMGGLLAVSGTVVFMNRKRSNKVK